MSSFLMAALLAASPTSTSVNLQHELQKLADKSDGRVGICAIENENVLPVCINGDKRYPLQSVMKLIVAAAVLDAIDRKLMQLDDFVIVRPEHASPGPQAFANLVSKNGQLKASIEELLQRAVAESDSTSVDFLIGHLGGISAVQDFLKRKSIDGISIDRDERRLQAESVGLVWTAGYTNPDKFEAAIDAVPTNKRDSAWNAYLNDPRDTATPVGMVHFLKVLSTGKLLSAASTQKLLRIMMSTETGRDRLKAGTPEGWSLGHKTGTGRQWQGMTSATNDVGILTAPDGGTIELAVFITGSKQTNSERAAIIAQVATLVTNSYRSRK